MDFPLFEGHGCGKRSGIPPKTIDSELPEFRRVSMCILDGAAHRTIQTGARFSAEKRKILRRNNAKKSGKPWLARTFALFRTREINIITHKNTSLPERGMPRL